MPANPKYLTNSPWQKCAKLTAGILGGYIVSALFHIALALLIDLKYALLSSIYTLYILWCVLIIVSFLFKNGWKAWLIYLLITLVLGVVIYFLKPLSVMP